MVEDQLQSAARALFEGVAPERSDELRALWEKYQPRFRIVDELGPDGHIVMQGGMYRDVQFNHRALRLFWIAAFVAWEGYVAVHSEVTGGGASYGRFRALLASFESVRDSDDSSAIQMPDGIPQPGELPSAADYPEARAAAELAIFATSWAFLHEMRHIQHQQDVTSAGAWGTPEQCHAEEFSCDEYATTFLLQGVASYAADSSQDEGKILQKRRIGIFFAIFAMVLIAKDRWGASKTHPALSERIARLMRLMKSDGTQVSDAIAHAAFVALWAVWPMAPGVFKAE